ncbi:hypothetical protein Golob_004014 [Gossypium lobatum]|uniref:Putative plant transposon protein domain-containing protein n=1 Tax=Gossypium lobatum TaxID=34289 RepID=A0A7J8N0G6_9ROSI|nr:hypothetical protein [Gossypium lobatum]
MAGWVDFIPTLYVGGTEWCVGWIGMGCIIALYWGLHAEFHKLTLTFLTVQVIFSLRRFGAARDSETNFCLPPEEPTIIPVVQELNLALKEREATRPYYELQTSVKVKGVNILLTDRSICQFYDASYYYRDYLYKKNLKEFKNVDMEEVLRFLTEGKEVRKHKTGTTVPKTFNQALMTLRAKIWMNFVCLRIWPIADLFDISPVQAIQVYAILQKKQISTGTWIYRNMIAFVKNQAKGTFFSYLIMELCKKVRVPMERMDKEMNPPKKLLAVCNFTKKTKGREEKNRTPRGR